MKNLRFHLIYLAIIGFLTYQYWTKAQALDEAVRSIEMFDKLIKANNEVVSRSSMALDKKIEEEALAYPNESNIAFYKKAQNAIEQATSIVRWLEKEKTEFVNKFGGYNRADSTILVNRLATNQFFFETKIQEIRDSFIHFQGVLNNIGDERKLKELKELYMTSKLLKDETYWQRLKNLTGSDALTQITAIQNRIHLDLIPYLNYNYSLVGHTSMIFDMYKVAAFPEKVALLEGETVKVDFYLSHYATNPGSNVTFWINNRQLLVNAGVAHFEKPETIVGKKIIKVTAHIRNPLTGQTTTANGEFEYEVLPKCAKNCQ